VRLPAPTGACIIVTLLARQYLHVEADIGAQDQDQDMLTLACRYRDIWRYSRLFVWSDETGRPWCACSIWQQQRAIALHHAN